jgi:hypothetical protein
VLEAASGSTRGREAGLRGARLSALPYARIVLIARRKATQNLLFFFQMSEERERRSPITRRRSREKRNERNIGLTVETDEIEREKGIVFMGIPSAFPMKRVRSSACPRVPAARSNVFQSALLIESDAFWKEFERIHVGCFTSDVSKSMRVYSVGFIRP